MPYSTKDLLKIAGVDQANRIQHLLNMNNYGLHNPVSRLQPTFGHAVGVGELIRSRRMEPEDENDCFVNYNFDLFCHIYANVRRIKPFPVKGVMGWKGISPDQEKFILDTLVL